MQLEVFKPQCPAFPTLSYRRDRGQPGSYHAVKVKSHWATFIEMKRLLWFINFWLVNPA